MRTISVEGALRWLQRFVEREWSLLLPVALAFFALPRLILLRLTPTTTRLPQTMAEMQAFSQSLPLWWAPLCLAVLLVCIVGAMALIALAVVPRLTVGQAILIGLRKLPLWIATGLMVVALFFVAMIVLMTIAFQLGVSQSFSVLLTVLCLLPAMLLMVLILPLFVDRPLNPWKAVRASWRLYTGALMRIAGSLLLFLLIVYIVSFAIQVSLGSLFLLFGRMAGQPQLGELFAAMLISVTSALGWSGFYLLVAAFYRQRTGID